MVIAFLKSGGNYEEKEKIRIVSRKGKKTQSPYTGAVSRFSTSDFIQIQFH